MSTYKLPRFTKPGILKKIDRPLLERFLSQYSECLQGKEIRQGSEQALDYEAVAQVFMRPDPEKPALADALYVIDEMATPEGAESLLELIEEKGLAPQWGTDPTPADVALWCWLEERAILERKHAEGCVLRYRSFEFWLASSHPPPHLEPPTEATLQALGVDLDDWFESKKRGRGTRVFVFPHPEEVWFLVRHGELMRREAAMDRSAGVLFRPEQYDSLIYVPAYGELRIGVGSKGLKRLYREKFGLYLFGDDGHFARRGQYTLEPLRQGRSSLVCSDISGLKSVRLREATILWNGAFGARNTIRADDVFAALEARGEGLTGDGVIARAKFEIEFEGSKRSRMVTIQVPNHSQFTRDSDSSLVEQWLRKRGFCGATDEKA